ncbi:MAG: hypothetical protein LQ343_004679 [Gyalolechia ehrenbergii]|nr:MAG: hypothetical protein LQ343_004679 [Gyalolechia ehrenbergii]
MRKLRLPQAEALRRPPVRRYLGLVRWSHGPRRALTNSGRIKGLQAGKVSLFDELFLEENKQDHDLVEIPRLPLSDIDHLGSFPFHPKSRKQLANKLTQTAAHGSVKQWNPAVLVLSRASKSLVDADFRRVAPKGRHIGEWTVIPGRDPVTFQQKNHYLLLFPNPSYARTYQNYVTKLHKLAQTHTPTSLQSPLPPPAGAVLEGVDAQTLFQDYALCPPSQRISLVSIFAPFGRTVRPLIENRGYSQLTSPTDRAGRAVLFWVDGCAPTTRAVRSALDQDGRDRRLPWATKGGSRSIEKSDLSTFPPDNLDDSEQPDDEVKRRSSARWIVTFVDENEARRFVRAWHRRPFPLSSESVQSEDAPLTNTEFLW